jgi:pimeloyl-ACP methyl ester carboxylesterase
MLAAYAFMTLSRLAPRATGALALWLFRRPAPARARIDVAGERLDTPGGEVMLYRIPARTAGERRGRVLLIHGWSGGAGDWNALAHALSERGSEVVVLDMPGHGRVHRWRSSLPRFVRALQHVAAVDGRFDAWVAHSGGGTAALAALATLDRTRRPGRVVLVAPLARARAALEEFCRSLRMSGEAIAAFIAGIERTERMSIDALDGALYAHELTMPILLVHDVADRYVPFTNSRLLHDVLPETELLPTSGLGHRRVLSAPAVVEKIADYLGGAPSAART